MNIKLIGTVLATSLLATSAFAGDASVEDKYKVVETSVPSTQNVCQNVQLPIYGNVGGGGASGTDVLRGMIIGGLLGKGIAGNDKGAAAGAVLGGIFQADKKQGQQGVVGYRQQQQCQQNTTYTTERKTIYSHSIVTFYHEGKQHRVRFNRYQ